MSDRRRRRRLTLPDPEPLEYAKAAAKGYADARRERDAAFASALEAGWTMIEIGEACGVSASTVCRIVNRFERAGVSE